MKPVNRLIDVVESFRRARVRGGNNQDVGPVDRFMLRAGYSHGIGLTREEAREVAGRKWICPGESTPVFGARTVDAGDPWAYGCMLAVFRALGIQRTIRLRVFKGC